MRDGEPLHFPSLDGLRGIAILLVLIHQLGMLEDHSGLPNYLFTYVVGVGWAGVQLFFVLSGFLITGILLDTQKSENYFSGFYARRSLRIFPLYYGALFIAFTLLPMLGFVAPNIAADTPHQIWLWTYLANWVFPLDIADHTFPHFWSLAVEEQFYLLWPLLLYKRSVIGCIKICCAIALLSLATRCYLAWLGGQDMQIYFWTVCRMDALVIGGIAAAALRMPKYRDIVLVNANKVMLIAAGIAIAGVLITHGYSRFTNAGVTIGLTLLAIFFSLVVIAAASADIQKNAGVFQLMRMRLLGNLGQYSYAIYVLHKPFHDFVGKPFLVKFGINMDQSLLDNILYILVSVIILYGLGFLSYHLFEKHFLRLKIYFAPK